MFGHLKVSLWPKKVFFLGFGISITSKNVFKPKKVNSDAFCHQIPALATPSEVDCIDWSRMTSFQEHLKAQSFMFLFGLLDYRIASPTSICFFFVEENPSPLGKQQLPELEGFHDSRHDVTIFAD